MYENDLIQTCYRAGDDDFLSGLSGNGILLAGDGAVVLNGGGCILDQGDCRFSKTLLDAGDFIF